MTFPTQKSTIKSSSLKFMLATFPDSSYEKISCQENWELRKLFANVRQFCAMNH